VGAELFHANERRDRQTHTAKLKAVFENFADATKDPPIECCPETDQSSPQVHTLFLIICFNNIITFPSGQVFFCGETIQ